MTNRILLQKLCYKIKFFSSDKLLIANEFNSYFTNIGPKLASEFNDVSDYKKYLHLKISQTIFLQPVSLSEIICGILSLKKGKAVGPDNIPSCFLQHIVDIISPALMILFNASIQLGMYPSVFKIARVTPIFKSGDNKLISNYRPISILSCLNMLFEKLIYERMVKFITKHNIINKSQFGFRDNHSTNHAILDMMSYIYDKLENNEIVCSVFIDLKKAFDTVDHKILLHKLFNYGFRGPAQSLLKSYLTNRVQFVKIGEVTSETLPIVCGVPQGSCLGPILFLTYINDLTNCSNLLTKLFADDTGLLSSHNSIPTLENNVNYEMMKVHDWMVSNKLTVNIEKSKSMIITPQKHQINHDLSIKIDGTKLENVLSYKYLGIFIDSGLKWDKHIEHVVKKITRAVGITYKLKQYMPTSTLRSVYFSLFQSYVQYGIAAWGAAAQKYLRQINDLQNRIARSHCNAAPRTKINQLYSTLDILKLTDLFNFEIAKPMHQHQNKSLPEAFDKDFTNQCNTHTYYTQSSTRENYSVPRYSTARTQNSIKYTGTKI